MTDAELLARQDALQREARELASRHRIDECLARLGRVIPVGSAVTGLMVWRDLDYTVDAPGVTAAACWDAVRPLLHACTKVAWADETGEKVAYTAPYERFYFVLHVDGWKVDITIWTNGPPGDVEPYQRELPARLDDETRLAILRLKEAWHVRPEYPYGVGAYDIYVAVLDHGVRTPDELERYLQDRAHA